MCVCVRVSVYVCVWVRLCGCKYVYESVCMFAGLCTIHVAMSGEVPECNIPDS